MLNRLIALTAFLPLSWAFYDTVPLVAWSSHESSFVRTLNEQTGNAQLEELLRGKDEDLCDFDAVAVLEQPGLHATDLKSLSPSSPIPMRLKSARSSAQIPYVRRRFTEEEDSVADVVKELTRRCGVRLQQTTLDISDLEDEPEKEVKYVFHMTLPVVYGEGAWRRYRMAELEEDLSRTLSKLESKYPKHLIIYTGSPSSSSSFLSKRQSLSESDQPFAFAPSNSTTQGGILARYQLLTPGLILSVGIVFFILLPIALFGIQALASIQSPVRLDAPQGVTQSKKNQ